MAALRHLILMRGAYEEERRLYRRERYLRDRQNPYDLPENYFVQIFRLNQEATLGLVEELRPYMHSSRRSCIPIEIKVVTALHFFACGGYQRPVGLNLFLNLSQKSVSRIIKEITDTVNEHLLHNWVEFPMNIEKQRRVKARFLEAKNFPGILGAIDCTHVKIKAPHINDEVHPEHLYVNRHGYHSINVQLICDYDLNILNVNAKYPGGTHDSFIWRSSNICRALENAHARGTLDGWLLGDSGYPLQPWLMTPVLNAIPGTPEHRYTEAHAAARNCIERCNGVLKSRFRCLLSERGLHYSPERASLIINTCVVLHNMCKRFNLVEDDVQLPQANRAAGDGREAIEHEARNDALRIRRQIIRARFS